MIKVSVFYPNGAGSRFDMKYYCERHIPMVRAKLGAACTGVAVEEGLAGAAPGSPPAFSRSHLYFDSVEASESFGLTRKPSSRYPHYTTCSPTIQISEVRIAGEPRCPLFHPLPRWNVQRRIGLRSVCQAQARSDSTHARRGARVAGSSPSRSQVPEIQWECARLGDCPQHDRSKRLRSPS